ncbi:hypothetical protein EDB19DRAFT_2042011 [Suillus lakei]|nr:hypothetical protein EDB19DRAFT_2042011 [Suillus lakei]
MYISNPKYHSIFVISLRQQQWARNYPCYDHDTNDNVHGLYDNCSTYDIFEKSTLEQQSPSLRGLHITTVPVPVPISIPIPVINSAPSLSSWHSVAFVLALSPPLMCGPSHYGLLPELNQFPILHAVCSLVCLSAGTGHTHTYTVVQSWRSIKGHLHAVLVKHNIFYYACGLFLSAVNVLAPVLFSDPAYYALLEDLQAFILAILATPMHLNLWHIDRHVHGSEILVCISMSDMSSADRTV